MEAPNSGKSRKRKSQSSPTLGQKIPNLKKCDRRLCDHAPFCFVQASEKCAKSGYTSRWYHISAGQHFCNECFDYFYRINKPGHQLYMKWSAMWEQEMGERANPGAKAFLIDQYLPVWVQCTVPECRKWRKLPATIDLHHVRQDIVKCSNCSIPQDEVVMLVNQPDWINTVSYAPLLRFSILASLLSEYVPSGVGISPTTVHCSKMVAQHDKNSALAKIDPESLVLNPLHPFNHPQEGPRARAFTPDNMEPEEIEAFPEYYTRTSSGAMSKNQSSTKMELYCLMRNLVLALWFFNYKNYLSAEKCVQSLSLRGLVRLWCAQKIPVILRYLTQSGYVNTGFMKNMPRPFPLAPPTRETVIVIGAGTAGLAAAYHLRNFGYQVKLLEASGRIGGRVKDDFSLGPCVGLGAMFITGIKNNPLSLLASQLGLSLQHTNEDRCELISEQGWRPEQELDNKVEAHFNEALDKLAEWRKCQPDEDVPLGDKLDELHQIILEKGSGSGSKEYSEKEKRLLDFHYSNLEFACGASLDKVSAFNWDHNDNFPQFSGCHALLPDGYMSVLSRLAEGFDVKLDSVVRHVQLVQREGEGTMAVKVTDTRRNEYISDRVIVTVPLAVLKANMVAFSPPLSAKKKAAIENIGAGLVEKVALLFPQPFWRNTVGNADFFGHIANSKEQRGMFGVFYDLSPKSCTDAMSFSNVSSPSATDSKPPKSFDEAPPLPHWILVTTVSGEGLVPYERMSDSEIVEKCVNVLRRMFPQETIPAPLGSRVSRWGADPFAQMSYSYAAVGSGGEDYDAMAEDIEGRVFFAGEATNRQHPQTVTGAYLSGIREASKIIAKLS